MNTFHLSNCINMIRLQLQLKNKQVCYQKLRLFGKDLVIILHLRKCFLKMEAVHPLSVLFLLFAFSFDVLLYISLLVSVIYLCRFLFHVFVRSFIQLFVYLFVCLSWGDEKRNGEPIITSYKRMLFLIIIFGENS